MNALLINRGKCARHRRLCHAHQRQGGLFSRGGQTLISILIVLVSLFLSGVACFTLWWMLHAWRTPETLRATRFADPVGDDGLRFSLLVPARHEQEVLEHTVKRLLESTHTDYEVLVIVGHD